MAEEYLHMSLSRATSIDILRVIDEEVAAAPKTVAERLDRNNSYIRNQLRELDTAGYVTRPSRGIYKLTTHGEQAVSAGDLVDVDEAAASN